MIVCDKHRFVYIDVPKTGSNSLDVLFQQCGGYLVLPDDGNKKHCRAIPAHAKEYDLIVSVRNPYKRIVSQYFFYQNVIGWFKELDFEQFVDRFLENLATEEKYAFYPIWKYIEPIGKPTYVVRLEHMADDVGKLPFLNQFSLPHRNKTRGKGAVDLTPPVIQKINQWAGKDFEMFGYLRLNHMKSFFAWQLNPGLEDLSKLPDMQMR